MRLRYRRTCLRRLKCAPQPLSCYRFLWRFFGQHGITALFRLSSFNMARSKENLTVVLFNIYEFHSQLHRMLFFLVHDFLDFPVHRTGERRFALPQPPLPFDGVREVTTFGNACPQQEVKLPIKFPIQLPVASVNRSEDCKLALPMQAYVLIPSIHRPFRQHRTSSQHSKRKGAPCSCGKFDAMHLLKI